MNLFKRLKRTWKLANKDSKILESLTDEQIDEIPDEDTKAVFISEGSLEDFKEYENEIKFGSKKVFDV